MGFIDFGIVGRIPPSIWGAIQGVALGAADGDYKAVAESLVQMGATDRDVNVDAFARDLEAVVASLEEIEPTLVAGVTATGDVAASVAVDEQQVVEVTIVCGGARERSGLPAPAPPPPRPRPCQPTRPPARPAAEPPRAAFLPSLPPGHQAGAERGRHR